MLTADRSRLIIIGAGDFARELVWLASEIPAALRAWEFAGFLDDDVPAATERMRRARIALPILGAVRQYEPRSDDVFACAIGSPGAKLDVCERMRDRGARFINLIHPSAAIGPGTTLGDGVIMCHHSLLTIDVRVGHFVTINVFSSAGHDAVIDDGCTISSHCDITGHAHLARGVFMGSHAVVAPGARVGELATVAAGSVVLRKVGAGRTAIGVPAKHL